MSIQCPALPVSPFGSRVVPGCTTPRGSEEGRQSLSLTLRTAQGTPGSDAARGAPPSSPGTTATRTCGGAGPGRRRPTGGHSTSAPSCATDRDFSGRVDPASLSCCIESSGAPAGADRGGGGRREHRSGPKGGFPVPKGKKRLKSQGQANRRLGRLFVLRRRSDPRRLRSGGKGRPSCLSG